jgi:molecular chaperone DnaK (HSP70)
MGNVKTDPSLIEALERAAKVQLTAEEIAQQRISFVMGSLDVDSTITRAQVEEILARQKGR